MRSFALDRASASLLAGIISLAVASGCAPQTGEPDIYATRGNATKNGSDGSDDANLGGVETDAPQSVDPRASDAHDHASFALETMMLGYWQPTRDATSFDNFGFMQQWSAILDGVERLGPSAYRGTARMFFELQNKRGWLDGSYDSEAWGVVTLTHASMVDPQGDYLSRARSVFTTVMQAYDGSSQGGVWSTFDKTAKTTSGNGAAVVASARLYELTQDASYLDFARRVYETWSQQMVDPATGQVFSKIASGVVDKEGSVGDQGIMIGAAVALAKAEGNRTRLELAHKMAAYTLQHDSSETSAGNVLSEGTCGGVGMPYGGLAKGIAARALADLYLVDNSHGDYREFLARSADALWTNARDPQTGFISCNWTDAFYAPTAGRASLVSAANALSAAARSLGKAAPRPAFQYEAEEAKLSGIGLEGSHKGFSGWGYAAGWGQDGESLDFLVDVPAAGEYTAEFRYASTDAASRRFVVDGKDVTANLAFPVTGAYETYATVTTSVLLTSGANTISLAFDAAAGSTNYINLDMLRLTAKKK
jgi:predicted alpha-1,6-mannanase (GH76 family)